MHVRGHRASGALTRRSCGQVGAASGSADSGASGERRRDVRREGPGHLLPADRADAAAQGCTERADRADRRLRVRGVERLRGSDTDPDIRAARGRGVALHPVPHDCALLTDPRGAALGAQPPQRRHGRHHRDRHLGARLQLAAPQRLRAARGDAEAQRLLHRAVRQVPRGAGLADQSDGTLRQLARRRRGIRVLLRLPRRRDQPVRASALREPDARRSPTGLRRRATT